MNKSLWTDGNLLWSDGALCTVCPPFHQGLWFPAFKIHKSVHIIVCILSNPENE